MIGDIIDSTGEIDSTVVGVNYDDASIIYDDASVQYGGEDNVDQEPVESTNAVVVEETE